MDYREISKNELIRLYNQWQANAKDPSNTFKRNQWIKEMIAGKRTAKKYEDVVNTLDCMPCATVPCGPKAPRAGYQSMDIFVDAVCVQETETKKMYSDARTPEQQAKDYLFASLEQAAHNQNKKLRKEFNLDVRPIETLGELRAAVKGSWFSVDESYKGYDDDYYVGYIWDYLTITNPDRKTDKEGYDKARKEMVAAQSDAKDQIVVFAPEKGLEALNVFKAKTFH